MAEKQYYVACLDLSGRSCLVVGGGTLAAQKARALSDCGANVKVLERDYEPSDLDGCFLVVAATDDTELQRRVFADAEARAVLCNVPDVPELCSFILPALHRDGPITIAVSTGGASPALAQRIRSDIAKQVGPRHAELAERLRGLRPEARRRFATYEERRDFFASLVEQSLG
jgi:siroheme synthase-like protein